MTEKELLTDLVGKVGKLIENQHDFRQDRFACTFFGNGYSLLQDKLNV